METLCANIESKFNELYHAWLYCTCIIPIDFPLAQVLTDIPDEILGYFITATGIKLPNLTIATKVSFADAMINLTHAINRVIELFRCMVCLLQAAGVEHVPVADMLLPLDFVLEVATLGYIVYDKPVCRILLGPVRVRGAPKTVALITTLVLRHNVYRHLQSCLTMGDFYETEGAILTVGSVHLREFTEEAAKKFILDVWTGSSMR